MPYKFFPIVLATALLTACGSPVTNPVTGKSERSAMSESAEVAEGKKGHAQVLEEYGVLPNAKVQAYVNDLGQRLAKQSHRGQLEWHFTVLDSPEINAFALPGGYVYVTRGIMAYMESEADLAGVIGHEIGHVTARHGAQRATRQQNAGLGVLAAAVLGAVLESKGVAGAGQVASEVSQNVAAGYIASYSREQELQADGLGAEYLSRSNYDPHNMVDVVNVLKNQERFAADQARAEGRPAPAASNWLSSHPSNDQRLQTITQLAAQYNKGNYIDEGRARYLRAIDGIAFGDSADQGMTRGRNFYHEPLGFAVTAPQGWSIQNAADRLTILSGERDAGLIVRTAPAQAGKTHDDIIRTLIKPDQGRVDRLQINGLPATRFVGTRKNDKGQSDPIEVTIVSGPASHNYVLQYAAKDAATLQRARRQIQEAEGSFRPMSPEDRAQARPWVVKTIPFPRGGFAEMARQSPLGSPEQQLRLINGVYGGGEPKPGQLVKTVVRQ
ncbi:MAG: M48 family metalloprotease [Rhodoferax sp.]|nr:M48 family metalloprotease [Rhodoferax sp.]